MQNRYLHHNKDKKISWYIHTHSDPILVILFQKRLESGIGVLMTLSVSVLVVE